MRVFAVTGFVLLVSSAAFAQDMGITRDKQSQDEAMAVLKKQMAEAQTRVPIENPIKGAPYSADIVVESTQTLADGNHISHQETSRVYRDGEGRTRREQSGTISTLTRSEPVIVTKRAIISIVDPVAAMSYSLDTEHKIAWRTPIATGDALKGDIAQLKKRLEEEQGAALKAQMDREGNATLAKETAAGNVVMRNRGLADFEESSAPLQHKVIDGIPVDGRVITKVIPAGAIGNDLPLTITSEEWTSPELHVLVMTRHSDPRTGETTYRLTNVVRAEPDPSLFVVPPDYTIKDTGIRRPEPR